MNDSSIPVVDALRVLSEERSDRHVVITNQGSSRIWPKISFHDLDFHYNPSTMGGAIPLALGMAIADMSREYLVLSGDGSLLMSLGSLVTVVGSGVTNLTVCVLDNGRYEVTGGQKTPAFHSPLDFSEMARATGFPTVRRIDSLDVLRDGFNGLMKQPGPRFASLVVSPIQPEDLISPAISLVDQAARLSHALTHPAAG